MTIGYSLDLSGPPSFSSLLFKELISILVLVYILKMYALHDF